MILGSLDCLLVCVVAFFFLLALCCVSFCLCALKGLMIDGPVDNIEIICRELAMRAYGLVKLIEQRVKVS